MTLSSPNYPKWYTADGIVCEWLISAPEGFIIALEFNHFHVSILFLFWDISIYLSLAQHFPALTRTYTQYIVQTHLTRLPVEELLK